MTNIILNDVSYKNEIIEELKHIYGDLLINEILNKDTTTQYFYTNIVIILKYIN
jgi:hypothetical protein